MRLVDLTPRQIEYYHDQHRFSVTCAGRRSRKTLINKRRVLLHALRNPGHRYFHGAPTRQQAKQIFWNDLKRYTREFTIAKSDGELWVRLINGTEIHIVGLDKPERIEGQPWHGCHITEFGNLKEGAWESNIRPILSDTAGFGYIDGVPEGRNHYYDLAIRAAGGVIPECQEKVGVYSENPDDPEWAFYCWFSSDVLPAAEVEAARNHLDEKTFRQEYQGSFESFEGLAYASFGKHNFSEIAYNPSKPVWVGMDFNVDPMTAVFCHPEGDSVHQFGEAYLTNSNTYDMIDHMKERFKTGQVTIFPDSTGRAEQSNATASDIALLRKAGYIVRARKSNPRVKDRVNAMNSLMRTVNGRTRYFINPSGCPQTMNDFNRVERLPDGRLNKKQEELGLKHISDACGYMVAYNFPVRSGVSGSISRWG